LAKRELGKEILEFVKEIKAGKVGNVHLRSTPGGDLANSRAHERVAVIVCRHDQRVAEDA